MAAFRKFGIRKYSQYKGLMKHQASPNHQIPMCVAPHSLWPLGRDVISLVLLGTLHNVMFARILRI